MRHDAAAAAGAGPGAGGAERSGAAAAAGAGSALLLRERGGGEPSGGAGEPLARPTQSLAKSRPSRRRGTHLGGGAAARPRVPARFAWERPCRAAGEGLRGVGLMMGGQQGPGS